jgi:hypothetical protein
VRQSGRFDAAAGEWQPSLIARMVGSSLGRLLTSFEVLLSAAGAPRLFPKYSVKKPPLRASWSKRQAARTRCLCRSAHVSANEKRSAEAVVDGQGVAGSNPVSPTTQPIVVCAGQQANGRVGECG